MLPEQLISYRVLPGDGNLSSPSPEKLRRSAYEHYLIMRSFFDGVSKEFFLEAFSGLFQQRENLDAACISYEQAQLFFAASANRPLNAVIAIEILRDLLTKEQSAAVLKEQYQFTPARFAELLVSLDRLNVV